MANRGTSSASGDVLVLNEDGTVTVGWDGPSGRVDATLRRPNAGEWLSFMEELEAANEWARGEETDDAGNLKARTPLEALKDGRYLVFYQRLFKELGDTAVETTDLPPWLGVGPTAARISNWWVHSPLHRSEVAAVTRTLSQ